MDLTNLLNKNIGILWSVTHTRPGNNDLFSDSYQNVSGMLSEEIKKLPAGVLSLIHEDDIEDITKKLIDLENDHSKNELLLEYRIVAKDNTIKWLKEYLFVERDESGEIVTYKRIAFDITDTKLRELELQEDLNNLQELNSAKDNFISIISHDLRAPFTSLLGFAEILLYEKDLTAEERNEYLNYILESSKSQLQLINCMLDWSRLQTGKIKFELIRQNIKMLVSNCVSSLAGDAIKKNIGIKINASDNFFVNIDERLLGEAIFSIIGNSIKSSFEGKQIFISINRFKEGMVEVIIKDEGLGFSDEDQEKIFKIDEKISLNGTKGERNCTLSLILAKEIIEKHNGDIWLYSKLNEGTEFHVILPEAKNIILIVEDEHSVRHLYKQFLGRAFLNFEILEASNGYEALSILNNVIPSIIITDHDMPLMDGIQFVEELKSKDSFKNIPVIVVTAKSTHDIDKKYHSLGIKNIFDKPINYHELISLMKDFTL